MNWHLYYLTAKEKSENLELTEYFYIEWGLWFFISLSSWLVISAIILEFTLLNILNTKEGLSWCCLLCKPRQKLLKAIYLDDVYCRSIIFS